MTRTSTAAAWEYFELDQRRDNVIDFSAYQRQNAMETQHYVLVPVEVEASVPAYTPRPRRNHYNAAAASIIHTALNLTVVGVTILLTAALVAMV